MGSAQDFNRRCTDKQLLLSVIAAGDCLLCQTREGEGWVQFQNGTVC